MPELIEMALGPFNYFDVLVDDRFGESMPPLEVARVDCHNPFSEYGTL